MQYVDTAETLVNAFMQMDLNVDCPFYMGMDTKYIRAVFIKDINEVLDGLAYSDQIKLYKLTLDYMNNDLLGLKSVLINRKLIAVFAVIVKRGVYDWSSLYNTLVPVDIIDNTMHLVDISLDKSEGDPSLHEGYSFLLSRLGVYMQYLEEVVKQEGLR